MVLVGNRAARYTAIALGVLAVVALVVILFPWNVLRGPLASFASTRLDRPVAIGRLDVNPGWRTQVVLEGVTIGNAAWSDTQPMATFPQIVLTFRLPALFRLTPTTTRLVEPDVLLEKNDDGAANWDFGGDRDDSGRSAAATIGSIDIDRGRVRYVDPTLDATIESSLQTIPPQGDGKQMLEFSGKGTLRGEPFEIAGRSQGIAELRNIDQPYGLMLNARAGKTRVAFDGTVVPAEIQSVKGSLHVQGPDLSQLYPRNEAGNAAHSRRTIVVAAGGAPLVGATRTVAEARCRFAAAMAFARTEAIIPAPEPTHALAAAIREAERCKESGESKVILTALCGHGLLDMAYFTMDSALTFWLMVGLLAVMKKTEN